MRGKRGLFLFKGCTGPWWFQEHLWGIHGFHGACHLCKYLWLHALVITLLMRCAYKVTWEWGKSSGAVTENKCSDGLPWDHPLGIDLYVNFRPFCLLGNNLMSGWETEGTWGTQSEVVRVWCHHCLILKSIGYLLMTVTNHCRKKTIVLETCILIVSEENLFTFVFFLFKTIYNKIGQLFSASCSIKEILAQTP